MWPPELSPGVPTTREEPAQAVGFGLGVLQNVSQPASQPAAKTGSHVPLSHTRVSVFQVGEKSTETVPRLLPAGGTQGRPGRGLTCFTSFTVSSGSWSKRCLMPWQLGDSLRRMALWYSDRR